ncbi:MAG: alginate lyase family protein [Clostridia bacterium]|nr:alginate lyase family protein [Clostridia bacterium]
MKEYTRLTDLEFFCSCLDTGIPALTKAKQLAEVGDYEGARHLFAEYVRETLDSEAYVASERDCPFVDLEMPIFEPSQYAAVGHQNRDPASIATEAENIYRHHVCLYGVEHTFGNVIDWEANPTPNGYLEWPWKLNRHEEWGILARHYLYSEDERAPAEWAAQLLSWAEQAQAPDETVGSGSTFCWRTIECGIRMRGWSFCIHAFLHSPAVTDEVITVFFKSICEHGFRLSRNFTRHNWLIMEMHGLTRISLLYPFLNQSQGWLALAEKKMAEEVDLQFYPDGSHVEMSTWYSYVVFYNYEAAGKVYRIVGRSMPDFYMKLLRRQAHFYIDSAAPNLFCPDLNDGHHFNIAAALEQLAQYCPDDDVISYIASRRAKGAPPAHTSLLRPYGGQAVIRESWEDDSMWVHMDCGPFGRAHQHEDKLGIILYAYGREMLPEAGFFHYDSSAMRAYVLSTRGHNTARIDGCDQNCRAVYRSSEDELTTLNDALFLETDRDITVEALYNSGYGANLISVTHRRRLIFDKTLRIFAVIDRFTAEDDALHSYEIIWHTKAEASMLSKRSCRGIWQDGVGIALTVSTGGASVVCGCTQPVLQGWLPDADQGAVEHIAIPTALFTGTFRGGIRVVTVIEPYEKQSCIEAVTASEDPDDRTVQLLLTDGEVITLKEA